MAGESACANDSSPVAGGVLEKAKAKPQKLWENTLVTNKSAVTTSTLHHILEYKNSQILKMS